MPQTLDDPSYSNIITNGGTDLFSYPNASAASVLGLQVPATQPLPPGTDTATNLLNPDQQVPVQLKNFPSNVYDTASTSLLTHFMTALMGNSGAGQVRKRQLVARLQQAITSTRFYDLDSFYGALFGAQRGPSGTLPDNPATGTTYDPYSDLASPDAMDEIEAIDASYRERIIQLARAITLGATVPGMQALAEAITGVQCDVYEIWRLLDNAEGPVPGYQTWEQVMDGNEYWSSVPSAETWQALEGVVDFTGLMGNGTPCEIVIQPKKNYGSDAASVAQQGSDAYGILSVAEVLRPAQTLVSVSPQGPEVSVAAQISSAWADSQYWELVELVFPPRYTGPAYTAITGSYQADNLNQLPAGTYVVPSPPLSRSSGSQYSYAADVTTASAGAVTGTDPNNAVMTNGQDFETVVFGSGKSAVTADYLPSQAVMPPSQAQTARTASLVSVTAAPYSGPRVPIMRSS